MPKMPKLSKVPKIKVCYRFYFSIPYALCPLRSALGLCFHRQNGIFRANLGADRTTRTQVGIDFDPVVPDIKSRAGQ